MIITYENSYGETVVYELKRVARFSNESKAKDMFENSIPLEKLKEEIDKTNSHEFF